MALTMCPGCGLPRAESESGSPCPVCAAEGDARPLPASKEPASPDAFANLPTDTSQLAAMPSDRGRGHRPEIFTGIIGLAFGVGIALALQPIFDTPQPTPVVEAAKPAAPAASTPAAPVEVPTVADPVPEIATATPVPPIEVPVAESPPHVAPLPRSFVPPPLTQAPAPRLLTPDALPRQPLVVTIDIDQPEGNYALSKSDIAPGQTIILRGRVKKFKTYTQPGVTIDASQLVAEEISISGPVMSRTVLKLNAPKGHVMFSGYVSGQSTVEVMATDGTVYFSSSGTNIGDGAKLVINTARLRCKGDITGNSTHLDVTLANGGSISAKSVLGAVRLDYRKTNPEDVRPILDIGTIDRKATIQRVD